LVFVASTFPAGQAAAADNSSKAVPLIKFASRSIQTEQGAFVLGVPVVVSRSDIESPSRRIGAPEPSGPVENERPSDPAFKGVLLTPRESTGRPAQPNVEDGKFELTSAPATDVARPVPASAAHPSDEEGRPSRPKVNATRPPSAPTPPKAQVAVQKQPAAVAPARKFGAAEIAATRAFTRF
jgi:hypothetical protein